jgi:thymidine kinase
VVRLNRPGLLRRASAGAPDGGFIPIVEWRVGGQKDGGQCDRSGQEDDGAQSHRASLTRPAETDRGALCYLTMDIISGHVGWIEVICGPMFSGKSEELIRRLRRALIARKRVQVFKPVIDTRYSVSEIVSHSDSRMHSETVMNAQDVLAKLDWRTQVVGIDEANFIGAELTDVAQQLADSGKQVIVAGLDTDYMGRPFAPIPDLLCLAESITKTLAICLRCGNPAKHTQRLVESNDLIVVGATGMYEARCRRCFEPGVPRQEYLDFAKPRRQPAEGG